MKPKEPLAVAVFVKTPGLSPVKTRLARTKGLEFAKTFYEMSVDAIASVCSKVDAIPYWAIAEQEGMAHPFWSSSNWKKCFQQGLGLGERMESVYSQLLETHEAVCLFGADSPHLLVSEVHQILGALQGLPKNDILMGPCLDGGFYALGGKERIESRVWLETPYSCSSTAKSWQNNLEKDHKKKVIHCGWSFDVDEEQSLTMLRERLEENRWGLTPEQERLRVWLVSSSSGVKLRE